jgi:hypothetical protein
MDKFIFQRAIFNPSMFGSTLEDTMEMQRFNFPDRKLPWIIGCLTDRIIQQNGTSVEGIFRYVENDHQHHHHSSSTIIIIIINHHHQPSSLSPIINIIIIITNNHHHQ